MTKKKAHIEMQLEIDTINAVPTPRFEVGENVLAAQLLHEKNSGIRNEHDKREQAVIAANDQEEGKVGGTNTLVNGGGKDKVSSEGYSA
ncbi:hypothetical protein H0H81_008430 [Sphagnurus paluster]|uniref:Uncharacterized protein n=1 Tax=Sphagnurus paluster TaxID=117069 RepID=A0A9P7K600_9AGAR|nr:hypothetical protein H0H81_008430 [Sphagnurus paluster]